MKRLVTHVMRSVAGESDKRGQTTPFGIVVTAKKSLRQNVLRL